MADVLSAATGDPGPQQGSPSPGAGNEHGWPGHGSPSPFRPIPSSWSWDASSPHLFLSSSRNLSSRDLSPRCCSWPEWGPDNASTDDGLSTGTGDAHGSRGRWWADDASGIPGPALFPWRTWWTWRAWWTWRTWGTW